MKSLRILILAIMAFFAISFANNAFASTNDENSVIVVTQLQNGVEEILQVDITGKVLANFTENFDGSAFNPDINGKNIVFTGQVDGSVYMDLYIVQADGNIAQLTNTPDKDEMFPSFEDESHVVYEVNSEIHRLSIYSLADEYVDATLNSSTTPLIGLRPMVSDKGNLAFTNGSNHLVIDGEDTGISGQSINWTDGGLIFYDFGLYLLDKNLNVTKIIDNGYDMAPDPNNAKLGIYSIDGNLHPFSLSSGTPLATTGINPDWYVYGSSPTGW